MDVCRCELYGSTDVNLQASPTRPSFQGKATGRRQTGTGARTGTGEKRDTRKKHYRQQTDRGQPGHTAGTSTANKIRGYSK